MEWVDDFANDRSAGATGGATCLQIHVSSDSILATCSTRLGALSRRPRPGDDDADDCHYSDERSMVREQDQRLQAMRSYLNLMPCRLVGSESATQPKVDIH